MLIHGLAREATDEVGLGAVGIRKGRGQFVQRLRAHRTLGVETLWLVAVPGQKKINLIITTGNSPAAS